MLIMYIILFGILMHKLGLKGKAYREEKRIRRPRKSSAYTEADYRRELEQEGYDDELISIILPVVMSNR